MYYYRDAVSGFFELPTESARKLLPEGLHPIEVNHGVSIVAVAIFDFTSSEVGAYQELVMSIAVPPLPQAGTLPKAAMYPYVVATNSRAARVHAMDRWHLPHWTEDVCFKLTYSLGSLHASVADPTGAPIVDISVHQTKWSLVSDRYQSFMRDQDGSFLATFAMDGHQSEHEDERGDITLYDHPFNAKLDIGSVTTTPFREIWMRDGIQTFDPLTQVDWSFTKIAEG